MSEDDLFEKAKVLTIVQRTLLEIKTLNEAELRILRNSNHPQYRTLVRELTNNLTAKIIKLEPKNDT